jgi:hypothetical protein
MGLIPVSGPRFRGTPTALFCDCHTASEDVGHFDCMEEMFGDNSSVDAPLLPKGPSENSAHRTVSVSDPDFEMFLQSHSSKHRTRQSGNYSSQETSKLVDRLVTELRCFRSRTLMVIVLFGRKPLPVILRNRKKSGTSLSAVQRLLAAPVSKFIGGWPRWI